MEFPWRRSLPWIALAGAAVPVVLILAFVFVESVSFGFGPADRGYVEGFRAGWARGTTSRWSREQATVTLPVVVHGRGALIVLGGRPERAPAEIEIAQEDRLLGVIPAGGKVAPFSYPLVPGRAAFRFVSRTADPGHGLKLEELRLIPEEWGALLPDVRSVALSAAAAVLFAAAFVFAGFSPRASAFLTITILGLPLAALDPFASLHWLRKGALVSSSLSLLIVLGLRSQSKWRKLVPAATLLAASFALFHPFYYFKDVDIHREVTDVVRQQGARELWSRMDYYQERFGLGRASLEGRRRPMPYPPVLHTIAGWFPFGDTEDVLKWTGILLHVSAVVVVMLVAGSVSESDAAAVAAGVMAASFPDGILELLRASYPALLGQLALVVMVFLVMRHGKALRSTSGVVAFGALFAACALIYNAGPLTLAIFLPLLLAAFWMPPPLPGAWGLLPAAVVGSLPALGYYGGFLLDLAKGPGNGEELGFAPRLRAATVGWDVFGPLYILFGLAGLLVVVRRRERLESRVLLAWAAYAPAISIPVLLAPEPLYYFRRLFFVYPLAPILAAVAVSRRKWLLVLATLALVGWSLYRAADFIEPFYVTHTGSLARPPS
jgi:hypothetical protein